MHHTHYTKYYLNQSGRGVSDIGSLYRGPFIAQRGYGGIGSFFSAVMRHLQPLVKSGLSALGQQSLKTGGAILKDVGKKPLEDILREQSVSAVEDLAAKGVRKIKNKIMQRGKGIKRKRKAKSHTHLHQLKRLKHTLALKKNKHHKRRRCKLPKKGKTLSQIGGKRRKRPQRRKIVKNRTLDIFD